MIRVCAPGPLVKGIDIYQGDLIQDINKVKASGVEYVFLKAYEYHIDFRFKSRWAAMKTAGLIRGAYDYFHPSLDPIPQADAFLNIMGHLEKGDLPPALDWESTDDVPVLRDKQAALDWLGRVEAVTKITPIIYTGPYFADALRLDSRFEKYPLWIAHYATKCPLVPNPWNTWAFWQNSGDKAHVPGMAGVCDTDVFNGDLDQLKAMTFKG